MYSFLWGRVSYLILSSRQIQKQIRRKSQVRAGFKGLPEGVMKGADSPQKRFRQSEGVKSEGGNTRLPIVVRGESTTIGGSGHYKDGTDD